MNTRKRFENARRLTSEIYAIEKNMEKTCYIISEYGAESPEASAYLEKCRGRLEECYREKNLIYDIINSIEDANVRLIMTARYVHGEKFSDIADESNFSLRNVYKLFEKGWKQLEEKSKKAV